MGCDIHTCMEVRKDGKWAPLIRMIPNKWYKAEREEKRIAEGKEPNEKPEVPETLYDGRNYDLFAMLADVRNGSGFAGCDTGDGFLPIAFPRGVPEDAHPDTKKFLDSCGCDGHSHTWHTLAHFEAYNWDLTATSRGWVGIIEFANFLKDGKPQSWSGMVGGGAVRHTDLKTMTALYEKHKKIVDKYCVASDADLLELMAEKTDLPDEVCGVFTQIQWDEPYRNCAPFFLEKSLPRLRELAKEEGVGPEDIRVCMFFDN